MNRTAAVALVFCLLSSAVCLAGKGENIALGKKYRLEPRPSYPHCTDANDRIELTDGVYTKGYFWTQKTTVGWRLAFPTIITIDLEKIEPICGVSYSTAAGVAGVKFPQAIFILISDDGKTYRYVGDLIEMSSKPTKEGYSLHRFRTDKLATRGRFVKLVIKPDGPYTFVDEIEIYRGDEALLQKAPTGKVVTDARRFFREMIFAERVRRRLRSDLNAVRDQLKEIGNEGLARELDDIEREIATFPIELSEDFKTIFPINELHARIFAVQAAIWRAKGLRRITIWQKNRWDMLSPTEFPRVPRGGVKVDVFMMNNEFRSAAFNISNAGAETVELRISIRNLPEGTNPEYIAVHDAPFTDTKDGVPVMAALPLAEKSDEGYPISIPSGLTKQVWLTFNPRSIPAGEYSGEIVIQPLGVRVPVRMKIYPLTFPDQPRLHLGGWDYTDREAFLDVTPQNRDALIEHLREHFVDTPWATRYTMPTGKYDGLGNMVEEPETENFQRWVERWRGARNYFVFAAMSSRFAGFEMGTPPFKKAVANWINWWVKKIGEWGIKPDQLGILLVDEPHQQEQDRTIVEYARIIKEAQPRVVIWEDPTWREPWNGLREMFEICDILCPNLPMWIEQGEPFARFYLEQRDAGRRLWFYSCSEPGKLLDPYCYHRMQHWFCFKYGAEGSCFWSFGDASGASCWNEYLSQRGAYTPVFLDPKGVTAGKHMEAIREGIEDHEYLCMLRDRIAELERKGVSGEHLNSARRLLESAADRVTACMTERKKIMWEEPKDRSVADSVRREILEALVKLSR